jgi:hypothetical protein
MNILIKRSRGILTTLVFCGLAPSVSEGQAPGRVVGRVLDARTAQPLASVQVLLAEASLGALTAVDGRYLIRDVPAGTYDLVVLSIGYATKTITQVEVASGLTTALDVTLDSRAIEVDGLTVTSAAERGSTTSLLTERKLAAVVSDAIGADQISRTPDGDAAAALKRVPGLSVVDGRYAYIRGLGERYSATTLNGAPLASPVPDKKVVPLDMIPSGLLQSIVTSKSYSPDQPGDYAGGLVQLRTWDFPASRLLDVSVSGGWNSGATFKDGLGYAGGGGDLLGFDDGTRDLPAMIPRDVRISRANFSSEQLQDIGRAFGGEWGPTPRSIPATGSLSFAFGQDFDLSSDRRAGFIASASYSSSQRLRRNLVERVFTASGGQDPSVDYRGEIAERSVGLGGLLSFTFQPRQSDQIKLTGVYNRLTDDISRMLTGFNLDSNADQWNSRLQYLGQSMVNSQLDGEHLLGFLGDAKLDWRAAYTRAARYEPSTREVLYREFDGRFYWNDFIQSGSVFHQDMVDEGWSGGTSLSLPLEVRDLPATASFGVSTDRKDRGAYTRRFRFRPRSGGVVDDSVRVLSPNELFGGDGAHIRPDGFEIQEATFRTDNYSAREVVDAAYAMLDLQPMAAVRISGGARVERTLQSVSPHDLWETGLEPVPGAELETMDVLPAVNATISLTDDMKLRAGASRTLARPQLRELAPFSFADYAGGFLVIGNPELERTRISNFDLRWEWFAGPEAVIGVSGFYKRFAGPIEVSVLPSSELLKTWVNAHGASNYGVEVELQSDLAFITEPLQNVSLSGNLTLVESDVETLGSARVYLPGTGATDLGVVSRNRPLQGQSPYVANAGLTWSGHGGASMSVLFNRFGRRIDAVGGQTTPDIFEEARSQLDAVVAWPLASGWRVKLAASRLVGSAVEFTQGGETIRSYDLGRAVSLALSWGAGR